MEFDLSPLWVSLKTAVVATGFAFFSGITMAGLMFNYRGRAQGFLDGILTLPLILPPTVVGFLLLLLFGRNSPLGQLLYHWGISLIFSWQATVVASTVVAFPLMYKTVLGAFRQVNQDLIHCARTLGASEIRIFWQILLPLAWPGVIAGTVLAFARALSEFGATLMLAGSIPGRTETMPVAIFFAAEAGKMGEALAWVLIMVGIALGAIAAIHHWSDSPNLSQSRIADSCSILINRCSTIVGHWFVGGWFRGRGGSGETTEKRQQVPAPGLDAQLNSTLAVGIQHKLRGFTLNVEFEANGKPLGILGASGSGKSMTLRCIAGLVTPNVGRIVLNDRVLFDRSHHINIPTRQRRIGFVFQNYALFPHMRVAQNIGFGLQHLSKETRKQRVQYYLELLHLQGLERRYPHELSGGQQQRVALARALAIDPDALLLDEPLSALDSYLRRQIEQLLAEVFTTYRGVTLLVTHKLEEAYRLCENLLVFSGGQVIAAGGKEDVFERPVTLTVAQLTECKNISVAQLAASQSELSPSPPSQVEALDWGCCLQVLEPIPQSLAYVGIRAHHLTFPEGCEADPDRNLFPCWLAKISEAPHRVTLYLHLNAPPEQTMGQKIIMHTRENYDILSAPSSPAYHLQAEVSKEQWGALKHRSLPWLVYLDPVRLMLIQG